MNHDNTQLPHARHWRDLPQPIQPRALSRGGRRRLLGDGLRVTGFALAGLVVLWGGWEVVSALQENPQRMPAAAKTVPVKHVTLKTDGHLDAAWLVRMLALPAGASLMELDLHGLRDRVLAHGQVRTAALTRNFPDTLDVRLGERTPVIRLRADLGGGGVRTLLVAGDGVAFEGVGFEPDAIEGLPWLAPARLPRQHGRLLPIPGMNLVADLLERARRETERLYSTWQVVSLAGLESDGEIAVRTKAGTTVVFGARGEFFPQLAKLDTLRDLLARSPTPPARIDLSLGREVPVSFVLQPAPAPAPAAAPAFRFFSSPPSREL